MPTPESKVKARVRRILEINKVYHFLPATGGYGRSGVPDIIGCLDGQFFAIECKAQGRRTTALQDKELSYIAKAGGKIFIIDETNEKAIQEWIDLMTVPTEG